MRPLDAPAYSTRTAANFTAIQPNHTNCRRIRQTKTRKGTHTHTRTRTPRSKDPTNTPLAPAPIPIFPSATSILGLGPSHAQHSGVGTHRCSPCYLPIPLLHSPTRTTKIIHTIDGTHARTHTHTHARTHVPSDAIIVWIVGRLRARSSSTVCHISRFSVCGP